MKKGKPNLTLTCLPNPQDVTPEYAHCLRALVKSDPLVKWLKKSMKKGKQE